MFSDDIAGEMREQTDARNASSSSEKRDIHEQPDERPSSMYLHQSAVHKGLRSSLTSSGSGSACSITSGSNTPEPVDIENSLAHTCALNSREGSKRTKRCLPPEELNVVHERLSVTAELPGLLRNTLLAAAVSHAEEDKKLLRDHTPDSMKMDDESNSTVSSVRSVTTPDMKSFDQENMEEKIVDNSKPSTPDKNQSLFVEDKTVKSESYLLESSIEEVDVQRSQSAPVKVASIYTQTEWSWMEDMQKYEQMKSEMQFSTKVAVETIPEVAVKEPIVVEQSTVPKTSVKETINADTSVKNNDEFQDELFRQPTVEYSSSSSDEDEDIDILDKDSFLPSIGPPRVLQYVKESENPPFTNEFPEKVSSNLVISREIVTRAGKIKEEHSCAFCKMEILEKVDVAQHASLVEAAKRDCPIYQEHLKQQSIHKEDDDFIKDEIIDIQPHPPFGTKAARKAAKERAAERAREREAERQKVSGTAVNYYAMTRQMKTLTYSLASTKCMDDGWTVRAPSPVGTETGEHLEPFEIEINSSRAQRRETFMERFYQNGQRLLVLFPDGTGCCYYPSGNPAVIISSTEKGKYSYILQEDTYEHSRENTGVLGVFDPNGRSSCYYQQTGKLRMVLTPFGGTFFNIKGEKKKKWFWYNITGSYVHAPPFQPITFAWTKELSLRCMGQDYIIITYNHGRHTIRFNVGAKLKPVVKKVKLPTDEEYYEIQLKEIRKFVNMLVERVQTTLRFPHSHRIHKLAIPERLNSKTPSRVESQAISTAPDDKATVVVN